VLVNCPLAVIEVIQTLLTCQLHYCEIGNVELSATHRINYINVTLFCSLTRTMSLHLNCEWSCRVAYW